jgi:hypothetical protein
MHGQAGYLRGLPANSPLARTAFVLASDLTEPPSLPNICAAFEISTDLYKSNRFAKQVLITTVSKLLLIPKH